MNLVLIIALIAVLFSLVVGYNIMLQYKIKVEATRRQESNRYLAIIDATEDLMSYAQQFPFSKILHICLHTRILDALNNMVQLEPKNTALQQSIDNKSLQIEQLEEANLDLNSPFKVPNSDKQAIIMLKLVKRLRETIRTEHNKGRLETPAYIEENNRLETIQIQINIENVIKRANDAMSRSQVGTANQLLKKGIEALVNKNDAYSVQARERLQHLLEEVQIKRQHHHAKKKEQLDQMRTNVREAEMDVLFGEKKKW